MIAAITATQSSTTAVRRAVWGPATIKAVLRQIEGMRADVAEARRLEAVSYQDAMARGMQAQADVAVANIIELAEQDGWLAEIYADTFLA
jgi:hypothetical protein